MLDKYQEAVISLAACGIPLDRIQEWAKAEIDGRMDIWPCKVGTPVRVRITDDTVADGVVVEFFRYETERYARILLKDRDEEMQKICPSQKIAVRTTELGVWWFVGELGGFEKGLKKLGN